MQPEQGEGVQTRQTGCLAPTMQHPDQQLPLLYRQQELQGGGEAVVRGRDQPREIDGSPARAHGEPGGQGDLEIRPDRRGHGDGHRPDRAVPPRDRTGRQASAGMPGEADGPLPEGVPRGIQEPADHPRRERTFGNLHPCGNRGRHEDVRHGRSPGLLVRAQAAQRGKRGKNQIPQNHPWEQVHPQDND